MKKTLHILKIQRYPKAADPSLKAWNAADELLIQTVNEREDNTEGCIVLHDRFGYLSCQLNQFQPQTVITFASQKNALSINAKQNNCELIQTKSVLDEWMPSSLAVVKIPKSLDLFKLYLSKLSCVVNKEGIVLCGFMTRNFTASWLKIASEYFTEVDQSRAYKKSRLLILKGPKPAKDEFIQHYEDEKGEGWKQYLGVFSSGRIDYASQFLMEYLVVGEGDITAVDVGSGNGVLGKYILNQNPNAELHLTDDHFLAVESGKLNVNGSNVHHHFSRNLDFLEDGSCDLVVSNPPFHFEYEINMDVAFQIFKDALRVLKPKGQLWIVANNNLPYKPELLKLFSHCEVVAQNRRFIIYKCIK